MALNDYEFSYRGLTFGGTTNYEVDRESGILDLSMRDATRVFPRRHGALPGKSLANQKIIEFIIVPRSSVAATLAGYIEDIVNAFNPFDFPDPDETNDKLVFKYPGFPEQFVYARPLRRTLPGGRTQVSEMGVRPIAIQMFAYDPRRYELPLITSAIETTTFNVTNGGNIDAYPKVTFTADESGDALLTNTTTGETLDIQGVTNDATVVADMHRTIRGETTELLVYEGSTDRYVKWQLPRTPFKLQPGVNALSLDTGVDVIVSHYDAWG